MVLEGMLQTGTKPPTYTTDQEDHWLVGSESLAGSDPLVAKQKERYPAAFCSAFGNVEQMHAKVFPSVTHMWGESKQAQTSTLPHSLSTVL